jgi:hypothetical protein
MIIKQYGIYLEAVKYHSLFNHKLSLNITYESKRVMKLMEKVGNSRKNTVSLQLGLTGSIINIKIQFPRKFMKIFQDKTVWRW